MMVGEQPGDKEDLAGRPFVGPAGMVLDRALLEIGVERRSIYLTNAVKHFKSEARGRGRLHKSPNRSEIKACRWWLDREIAATAPHFVVALGATAAFALMGRTGGPGAGARPTPALVGRARRHGDDPPVGNPAILRRRRAPRNVRSFCRRSPVGGPSGRDERSASSIFQTWRARAMMQSGDSASSVGLTWQGAFAGSLCGRGRPMPRAPRADILLQASPL